jgi:FixJ family two-component response regulator
VTDKPRNDTACSNGEQLILVIDDDLSMRQALTNLLESIGLRVAAFGTARELLEGKLPVAANCMILDIRLPGLSGLDLQAELAKAKVKIPIIFMTGHGDIPMTVKAMKSGAIDFLTKPFRDQDLLDAVATALDHDRKRRNDEKIVAELQRLAEALTPRELQVMTLVTDGLMNKQIAHELGISEITVKIHRGSLMKKMGAHSLADLVRMAGILGLRRTRVPER